MHNIFSNMSFFQMGSGEPEFLVMGLIGIFFFPYHVDFMSIRMLHVLFLLITMMNIPNFLTFGILQLK